WDSIPMFSCTSQFATQQIVLYESTYVIDIFIKNKPICATWNGGLAILGIQNATGTLNYTAPGKNGTQWTATNEGHRFIPSGTPSKSYEWKNLNTGIVVSTNPQYIACVNDTTQYELKVTYDSGCDTIIKTD